MRRLVVACAIVVTLATASPAARACSLDGRPSLLVAGRLVVLNRVPPAGGVAAWTPFVASGTYPTGRPLALREVRRGALLTLPPSAFATPLRWTFGDGTTARGLTVRHAYRRPGAYVVTVFVFLRSGQAAAWYQLDAALVHVR